MADWADRAAGGAAAADGGAPAWRVVAGAFLGLATGPNIVLLLVFGVFVPQLRAEFGWGIGEVSLGATIICFTLAVASPLQGYVVDRFGARLPILVSLPVFGVSLCSMALLGPDIRIFHIACGLLVLSALGAWSLSYITLVTSWFDRRLGLALGVSQLGAGLGGGVVPLLLAAVFAVGGWRAGYLALGLAQFAMWPVAFATARGRVTQSGVGNGIGRPPGLALREVVRERSFALLCSAFLLLGCFSAGVIIHQVSMMLDRGLPSRTAVALQAVLLLSSMAGRLLAGWALDRLPLTVFMPALLAVTAVACATYASDVGTPILVASAVVMGLAIGAEFDVLGYSIRRYFGLASFGLVFGLIFGCFQIGGGVGAALMGFMRERSGSYVTGLWLLAAFSGATALLLASLGRYRFSPGGPAEPTAVGTLGVKPVVTLSTGDGS